MTDQRFLPAAEPYEPRPDAELLIGLLVSPSLTPVLGPDVTTSLRDTLTR